MTDDKFIDEITQEAQKFIKEQKGFVFPEEINKFIIQKSREKTIKEYLDTSNGKALKNFSIEERKDEREKTIDEVLKMKFKIYKEAREHPFRFDRWFKQKLEEMKHGNQ